MVWRMATGAPAATLRTTPFRREKDRQMPGLERDGVWLNYQEIGSGSAPFVFVHGAGGCDHTDFAPQVAHFGQRHRVVAVDLRGHGSSSAPEQDYSIPGHADDVAWMIQELGLYKPIVVGHSMGGAIAFDLAARYPDLLGAIVAIDAPVVVPPEVGMAVAGPLMGAMGTPNWNRALRDFMASAMHANDDPVRCERILTAMEAFPAYIGQAEFRSGFGGWDARAAISACTAPAMYIQAAVPADLDLLRQLCPGVVIATTSGNGHWVQLEAPDQVNTEIEGFVRALTGVASR
jgi:pimeloyl-ACP methyl ester carboxylesterase